MTPRIFKYSDAVVTVRCTPDTEVPTPDTCGECYADVVKRLARGEYAAYSQIRVRIAWAGFAGADYLSGCIFETAKRGEVVDAANDNGMLCGALQDLMRVVQEAGWSDFVQWPERVGRVRVWDIPRTLPSEQIVSYDP